MAKLSDILKRRAPLLNFVTPDQTVWDAAEIMAQREVASRFATSSSRRSGSGRARSRSSGATSRAADFICA